MASIQISLSEITQSSLNVKLIDDFMKDYEGWTLVNVSLLTWNTLKILIYVYIVGKSMSTNLKNDQKLFFHFR